MVKTKMIVNQYIYRLSNEENIKLEDYLREILGELSKGQLKRYCNNNNISFNPSDDKEKLFKRIYELSNSMLEYMLLTTEKLKNESLREYYYRIYIKN